MLSQEAVFQAIWHTCVAQATEQWGLAPRLAELYAWCVLSRATWKSYEPAVN